MIGTFFISTLPLSHALALARDMRLDNVFPRGFLMLIHWQVEAVAEAEREIKVNWGGKIKSYLDYILSSSPLQRHPENITHWRCWRREKTFRCGIA